MKKLIAAFRNFANAPKMSDIIKTAAFFLTLIHHQCSSPCTHKDLSKYFCSSDFVTCAKNTSYRNVNKSDKETFGLKKSDASSILRIGPLREVKTHVASYC
jgi:hypothetical protein